MVGVCSTIAVTAQTAPNLASAKTFGVLSSSSITATDTITVSGNAGATTSVSGRIKATTVYTGGTTVSTALTDLAYTSADSTGLYAIASQCATEGGNAVYQSRNLLMFIANKVINFYDPCDANTFSEEERSTILQEDKHAMKLYPNPNAGSMTLESNLNDGESGILFIYDLTGKLVSKYNLANGTKSLGIDAHSLNPGTYVYEVIVNGKPIKKDKLTIIK